MAETLYTRSHADASEHRAVQRGPLEAARARSHAGGRERRPVHPRRHDGPHRVRHGPARRRRVRGGPRSRAAAARCRPSGTGGAAPAGAARRGRRSQGRRPARRPARDGTARLRGHAVVRSPGAARGEGAQRAGRAGLARGRRPAVLQELSRPPGAVGLSARDAAEPFLLPARGREPRTADRRGLPRARAPARQPGHPRHRRDRLRGHPAHRRRRARPRHPLRHRQPAPALDDRPDPAAQRPRRPGASGRSVPTCAP